MAISIPILLGMATVALELGMALEDALAMTTREGWKSPDNGYKRARMMATSEQRCVRFLSYLHQGVRGRLISLGTTAVPSALISDTPTGMMCWRSMTTRGAVVSPLLSQLPLFTAALPILQAKDKPMLNVNKLVKITVCASQPAARFWHELHQQSSKDPLGEI